MKTITVQGMHCGACEKLIRMELDDAGIESCVEQVEVQGEAKKGLFYMKEDTTEEQIDAIKQIINGMEGYSTE